MKSDLETTIKIIDSKHVEILSAIESADSKRKKMESVAQHIGLIHQKFRQVFAKQKRLRNIWVFFDRREDDLLNQEFRIIRALNEIFFFPLMTTGWNFLKVPQNCPLVKSRRCLISIIFKSSKDLIFRQYPFLPL